MKICCGCWPTTYIVEESNQRVARSAGSKAHVLRSTGPIACSIGGAAGSGMLADQEDHRTRPAASRLTRCCRRIRVRNSARRQCRRRPRIRPSPAGRRPAERRSVCPSSPRGRGSAPGRGTSQGHSAVRSPLRPWATCGSAGVSWIVCAAESLTRVIRVIRVLTKASAIEPPGFTLTR